MSDVLACDAVNRFRETGALSFAGESRRRIEIENARFGRTDDGALIKRGEPPVREVIALEGGQPARMGEHHVGRQFLGFTTETIGQPRAEGGIAAGDASGIDRVKSLGVIADARTHRADQADVIGDLGKMRQ